MSKKNTKKQTGLKIVRNGDKFICSWSTRETYKKQKMEFVYRANKKTKKKTPTISAGTKKKVVKLDLDDLKNLSFVRLRLQALANKKDWSDWAVKEFDIDDPNRPTVDMALSNLSTVSVFGWETKWSKTGHKPFDHVHIQTLKAEYMQDNPNNTKAEFDEIPDSSWEDVKRTVGDKQTAEFPASGTKEFTEDSSKFVGDYSYTRVVRARAEGAGGHSNWNYAWHVYARAKAAVNISAVATLNRTNNTFECTAEWSSESTPQHPIDEVQPQYAKAIPETGMTAPDDASWVDIPAQRDTTDMDAVTFSIDGLLAKDQCVFFRVKTYHDNVATKSIPVLATGNGTGDLKDPTGLRIEADDTTHRVRVYATNASEVEDSFIVIYYIQNNYDAWRACGIIPFGSSYVDVQCDNWSDNMPYSFGARTVVASWASETGSDNISRVKIFDRKMQSEQFIRLAGVTAPIPPNNVTVDQADPKTILVKWQWEWGDADGAEVSWSDYENAWDSTQEPETHIVKKIRQSQLYITDLEAGIDWYVRVRYFKGEEGEETYSLYSAQQTIRLTTVPTVPQLTLSPTTIAQSGSVEASWVYVASEDDEQQSAQVVEIVGNTEVPLANVTAEQKVTIPAKTNNREWETGTTHKLAVRVKNTKGQPSPLSNYASVMIADPIEASIENTNLEQETIETGAEVKTGSLVTLDGGDETNVRDVTSLQVSLEPVQAGTPSQGNEASDAYLMKASPTTDFNSEYLEIIGGTVAWNQLLPDGTRANTNNGISYTRADSAPYILNGTATANAVFLLNTSNLQAIKNHKYLFYGGKSTTVYLQLTTVSVWSGGVNPQDVGAGKIANAAQDGEYGFALIVKSGTTVTNESVNPQLFDLTQMFGTTIADYIYSQEQATAGAGVAFFRKMFPKPYYAYNAGELMSVKTSSHQMVGFNQFDKSTATDGKFVNASGQEVTSPNYGHSAIIPVFPSTTYYMKGYAGTSYYTVLALDIEQNPIGTFYGGASKTEEFSCTLPSNCYYVILNYLLAQKDSVCFNLHWDGERDGEYEEYVKHSYPLDSDLELRGIPKLDASNNLYYDGDTYESDGSVSRRYGIVDLGTLTWIKNSNWNGSPGFYIDTKFPDIYIPTSSADSTKADMLCSRYEVKTRDYLYVHYDENGICLPNGGLISVRDSAYADYTAEQFQTAMSGVYLIYKLNTPTTEEADAFTSPQTAYPYGTESFTDTRSVPIPVGTTHRYASVYPITGHDEVTAIVSPTTDAEDGQTYTADLEQTVYGGNAELVGGTGKSTMASVDLGTLNWGYSSADARFYSNSLVYNKQNPNAICSHYQSVSLDRLVNGTICVYSNGYIYVKDSRYTSAADFKTAMNGVQLVYELATPTDLTFTPQTVTLNEGINNVWSEQGDVTIRTVEGYEDVLALKELPLRFSVTGTSPTSVTNVVVKRAENFEKDRPNGDEFRGYKGEVIYSNEYTGAVVDEEITLEDVIAFGGSFDDTAEYSLEATLKDSLGQVYSTNVLGQDADGEDITAFVVDWTKQATEPSGTVVIEDDVAKITPTADSAYNDDYCNIYRLSADKPVLIAERCTFGETYVDPYPAIGTYGYRIVLYTANGDYTKDKSEHDEYAWEDIPATYESDYQLIDFADRRITLSRNVDLTNTFTKDFQQTKYLGGAIQGDWNKGVGHSAGIASVAVTLIDQDDIDAIRELCWYEGQAHVRTKDGACYTADIQVSDSTGHDKGGLVKSYNFSITRVESQELDGVLLEDWEAE